MLRNLALLGIFAGMLVAPSLALKCWECTNVKDHSECKEKGAVRECGSSEYSCELEYRRHHGWGGDFRIYRHCKQPWACGNNHIQNPRPAWSPAQCLKNKLNQVCRCCCFTDECNMAEEECWGSPSCNRLPSVVYHGTISCTDDNNKGSVCTLTCDSSTQIVGEAVTYCGYSGSWSRPLGRCEPKQCQPRTIQNGWYICSDGSSIGSNCRAFCRPGYNLFGRKYSSCRRSGNAVFWTSYAACEPMQCPDRGELPGGVVTCSNGSDIYSRCNAECLGNTRLIGIPHSYCQDNGEWSHPLPSCELIQCPILGQVIHGTVTCTMEYVIGLGLDVGTQCTVNCDDGYSPDGKADLVCLETGYWSDPLPWCLRNRCPDRGAVKYGDVRCSDFYYIGSECTVICHQNHYPVGEINSVCGADELWSNPLATCEKRMCPERGEIAGGRVFCRNKNNIGSVCTARCNFPLRLIGEPRSMCHSDGNWTFPLPTCGEISCPITDFQNGVRTCSADYPGLGSTCWFLCDPGYVFFGPKNITCLYSGQWSSRNSLCREIVYPTIPPTRTTPYVRPDTTTGYVPLPAKRCPDQGVIKNGVVECGYRTNLVTGTETAEVCDFRCFDGYQLFPPGRTSNVCEDGAWNVPKPCCTRPCPPYAEVDMVLVLDSSSSVGVENWELLTDFVEGVIRTFTVADDAAHFAIFRYNNMIDTDTDIHFSDFPDDRAALIRKFEEIPYDGQGTFTGQALQHAWDDSLAAANGNRPDVLDVVMVITDGKSADDVETPARLIRNSGATIIVLGIEPPRGSLDRDQLLQIAGLEDNVVIAEGGFGGLGAEVTAKLSASICKNRC